MTNDQTKTPVPGSLDPGVGHGDLDEIDRLLEQATSAFGGAGDAVLYSVLVDEHLPLLIAEVRGWRAAAGMPNAEVSESAREKSKL